MSALKSRRTALGAAWTAVALGAVGTGLMAVGGGAAEGADAPVATALVEACPPEWGWPGVGNGDPAFTDGNVSTFVGGDFLMEAAAAEVEGRLMVLGQARFAKDLGGPANIGRAGVGSQVVPPPGTPMLQVGSSRADQVILQNGTTLDVGHGLDGGGSVRVGGLSDPDPEEWGSTLPIETSGGQIRMNVAGLATLGGPAFRAGMDSLSSDLDAHPAGSYPGTSSFSGTTLTLTGGGPSTAGRLQVFDVDGTALPTTGAIAIDFRLIPDETYVVVNLHGATVTLNPYSTQNDGSPVDASDDPLNPVVSTRTMWNLPDASEVSLPGTSPVLGSVLAPVADRVTLTTSVNGRVLVGGDLTMNGQGNEIHAYHWGWAPSTSCEGTDELPEDPGRIAVAKEIIGTAGPGGQDQVYTGIVTCRYVDEDGEDATVIAPWSVQADETALVVDLPVGAVCTAQEIPIFRGLWAVPELTPEQVVVPTTEDFEADPAAFTFTFRNASLLGFSLTKTVTGETSGLTDPTTTFPISYACEVEGEPTLGYDPNALAPVPGTETVTVDVPADTTVRAPYLYPTGSTCRFTEEDPDPGALAEGFEWGDPVALPADGTIVVGTDTGIGVENTIRRAMGTFSVLKELEGTEQIPPDGFEVGYVCRLDGAPSPGYDDAGDPVAPDGTGWIPVEVGTPSGSPRFAVGSVCVLAEDIVGTPIGDGSTEWSHPVFTPSRVLTVVADEAGGPVRVTVTNSTRARHGALSVMKVTEPVPGSAALPLDDVDFTVELHCTTDEGPAVGIDEDGEVVTDEDGDIDLTVHDGESTGSPLYPIGTECEATELAPPPSVLPEGGRWEDPRISPEGPVTITIAAATDPIVVTVTNRYEVPVTPTPTPTTPGPTPSGPRDHGTTAPATGGSATRPGGLPVTGPVAAGALVVLAGGLAALGLAIRRRGTD